MWRMAVWLTGIVSLVVAFVAASLAYWNNRRMSAYQGQLARVNKQLEELYGPLLALSSSNTAAWREFVRRFRPGRAHVFDGSEVSDQDRQTWILWMNSVFLPSNRRSAELITTKAHLMVDDAVPQCLLDFCAHVAGYEVTAKRWEQGDYTVLSSVINHPGGEYNRHIQQRFLELKQLQQRLLAVTESTVKQRSGIGVELASVGDRTVGATAKTGAAGR